MNVKEAAALLRIHERSVQRLVADGTIPGSKQTRLSTALRTAYEIDNSFVYVLAGKLSALEYVTPEIIRELIRRNDGS